MDAILVDELNQVLLDLHTVQIAVETLQARVKKLMSRVQEQTKTKAPARRFTDLKGILGGVNISYEEIKAAEYQVPEDLL